MKTDHSTKPLFPHPALLFASFGLALLSTLGCDSENEDFQSQSRRMLLNSTYVAFHYQNSFVSPVRLVFTDGETVEVLPRNGERAKGFYEVGTDSTLAIIVPNQMDKTKPFRDDCRLIYAEKERVWFFRCEQMNHFFIAEQDYGKIAESYAVGQFRLVTWEYGKDANGEWAVTLTNRGKLPFDSVALCLNGKTCEGMKVKVRGREIEFWEGSEYTYRYPNSSTGCDRSLEPGKTLHIPIREAVCQKTGRIYDPDEYSVTEIHAKGKVRFFDGYLDMEQVSLKRGK